MSESNVGTRFDRLPATDADRRVEGRPSRAAVCQHFTDRYGIDRDTLEPYTFWEKGAGKVWALRGEVESPVAIEALGIHVLRTRQRHWKLTTDAAQLFGRWATKNVLEVAPGQAAPFWAGTTQSVDSTVDNGYVIVAQRLGDAVEPLGVGMYVDGELRSVVPKSRRRELPPLPPDTT